jgi:hypothetical protein
LYFRIIARLVRSLIVKIAGFDTKVDNKIADVNIGIVHYLSSEDSSQFSAASYELELIARALSKYS